MPSGLESDKLLEEVKKVIRSLLLSTKHGLTINELCSEYELILCQQLPFKKLGFSSPLELIRAIPDVVRSSYQSGGAILLRGVADESTQHIRDLVCGQKSTKRRNTKFSVPKQISVKYLKKTVPSFIKAKIQNLIYYYPQGIELKLFENAFLNQYGRRLNPQVQGFSSVCGLLEACADIIKIHSKSGVPYLYPIKSDKRYPSKVTPPLTEKYLTNNNVLNGPCKKEKKKIDDTMKMKVFTVLIKRKNGIFSARFPFEYKAHYNNEFDLQSLGYSSVVEFMAELSDVVDITRPTEKGDFLLIPKSVENIEDNKTQKVVDYTTMSPGNLNDNIEICISYIVDPSLFWIQVTASFTQLYELMDEMTNFYHLDKERKFILPESSILPGQPCAALYEDNQWYRAVIRDVLPDKVVGVYYVDYGNESEVKLSSICILKDIFMKLPCQAFKAKLHGVTLSKNSDEKWSTVCTEKFYELTCDQYLRAKIIEKEPVLSLDIMDAETNDVAAIINYFSNLSRASINCEVKENSSHLVHDEKLSNSELSCNTFNDHGNNKLNPSFDPRSSEVDSDLIKCLRISENYSLHILQYEGLPYVLSMEISGLFWDADVLRQMLHQKNVELESKFLLSREHGKIFSALERYYIGGTQNGKLRKTILSIYKLSILPQIFTLFEPKHKKSRGYVLCETKIWNDIKKEEDYWCPATNNSDLSTIRETVETLLKHDILMFKRRRLQQMISLEEYTAPDSSVF